MSILNKPLNREALATLDLFLQGALAPLSGYLKREDHLNVLQNGRLTDGYLWPLPFTLELTAEEKRQAQLAGRIALLDEEQRTIAEVDVEELYRLPNPQRWYVGGVIKPVAKVLHPAFNRIRRHANTMQSKLHHATLQQVIAVHTSGQMSHSDMQQAGAWLKENGGDNSSIMLQVSAPDSPQLHEQMRELRSNIRRNFQKRLSSPGTAVSNFHQSASKVVLSLLPATPQLNATQQILLQARIAKNYGATAFLIPASVSTATQKMLLRHRDELGLDLVFARHSQTARAHSQHKHIALKMAA